jgi:transcriptional regulator of acetoin/glycerol metabolism
VHTESLELRHTLACNHDLLAHSQPVMEFLFEQVRHTDSVVALAAPCGTLMHTQGDPCFLGRAERVALMAGACWHEDQRGTNAIGTALAEMGPVQVHGAEHFLERNAFLTCAAAPILSGTGRLLGVLDISGEHSRGNPHTLGLVGTAARMIENRLLVADGARSLRLHLHAQPEGIGTVAEGILRLSEDGTLLGANRAALGWLGLSPSQLGTLSLAEVLDRPLQELLARQQRRPGLPQAVQRHDGALMYAQLFHEGRVSRPVVVPEVVRAVGPTDALDRLDTGDMAWRKAAAQARRVLGKSIAVLVQGESGVGKEWFARALHDSGPRQGGPFVAVNCAALPENLIEAELFGHEPGAFTGARREGRKGLLREAHGGTLFLDEIGDMPLPLQTRLLRVLQERQVVPLGGSAAVSVDVELVCATHQRLREAVEAGRFRADLYYRINGLTVALPPLRERQDFEALTQRLLDQIEPGRGLQLAPALLARLSRHPWPGNLRQYASVLRTACAMLDAHEDTLQAHHLSEDMLDELDRAEARARPAAGPARPPQNLQELSRTAVAQALENCRGNISQAARVLGISRQTLYRKLQLADGLKDGLSPPAPPT